MKRTSKRELLALAKEVRDGILELQSLRDRSFRRIDTILATCKGGSHPGFPRDWCNFATLALAGYISRELQRGDVYVVTGENEASASLDSHSWVKVGGYLVDLTCDQFSGAPECPFVSRSSLWHEEHYPPVSLELFAARFLKAEYLERAVLKLTVALERLDTIASARVVRALSQKSL